MPALVGAVTAKSKGMKAQELANSLWAAAQLADRCPEVLEMTPALVAQIPGKAGDMNAQDLSNIVLAAAKLQDVAPVVLEALPAIATEITGKASSMKPQELSNSLWAAAKLQDAVPEVLQVVPAVAARIPSQTGSMIPQALSNCLFAAMRLEDAVPEVLEAVPALVKEVPAQIDGMAPQNLANSLEALVVLEERLSIVELPGIATAGAARLKRILPEMSGKDLVFNVPMVLWACGRMEACVSQLLAAVAERFPSKSSIKSLPARSLCALGWTYRNLDEEGAYSDFSDRLEAEIAQRGLREEEVLPIRG